LESVTIAEALKAHGYRTACIGKWHLGKAAEGRSPTSQGFDIGIGARDTGSTDSHFFPYGPLPGLEHGARGEYLTDRLTNEAIKFMQGNYPGANKSAPFFLFLSHYAVHTPLQAPQDLVNKYSRKSLPSGYNYIYAAMIERLDFTIGNLLSFLDTNALAQETLVIFTSDNGGLLTVTSNRPLRGGKGTLYEGGIREPLIFRWKGVLPKGVKIDTPVMFIDFFPTILEVTRIPPPSGE
jgi:arylsulfatase A-like enzyme